MVHAHTAGQPRPRRDRDAAAVVAERRAKLSQRVGELLDGLPDRCVEAFAGGFYPRELAITKTVESCPCCRTAALGGHREQCDTCEHQRIAYNSCRNRHCPKCLTAARNAWVAARERELLPVGYVHVVFTVPEEIAAIACQNKKVVYGILFHTTAQTLTTIAADPKHLGARIGITAVLHTWGSAMTHHPHVHMIVPGGGIALDGAKWVACKPGFFVPVRVLSKLFRRLMLDKLAAAHAAGTSALLPMHIRLPEALGSRSNCRIFQPCPLPLRVAMTSGRTFL